MTSTIFRALLEARGVIVDHGHHQEREQHRPLTIVEAATCKLCLAGKWRERSDTETETDTRNKLPQSLKREAGNSFGVEASGSNSKEGSQGNHTKAVFATPPAKRLCKDIDSSDKVALPTKGASTRRRKWSPR